MTLKTLDIETSQPKVSFQLKRLGFLSIKGVLTDFLGNLVFDEKKLESSKFNVSINATTISTGNAKRTKHLKSVNFFNVQEFLKINFKSTKITGEENHFFTNGKLTILNTSKEMSIPFSHGNGLLTGNFSLHRIDFGLAEKFQLSLWDKQFK